MAANYLKLNDDKTEFIVIRSPHMLRKVTTSEITIGEHRILAVKQARNIGAEFDCNMNMEAQVNKTVQRAWYKLYSLSKIRQYLTEKQAQHAIHAFVTSQLDMNNSLLCNLPAVLLNKLQRVQNAAAKVIKRLRKHDHVTHILKELHWLQIDQRYVYKILLIVYKCLNGKGPQYLCDKLHLYQPKRDLRSKLNYLLDVPKTRSSTLGDRAFSTAAPKLWNNLPINIRESPSVDTFKSSKKTHLFKICYK